MTADDDGLEHAAATTVEQHEWRPAARCKPTIAPPIERHEYRVHVHRLRCQHVFAALGVLLIDALLEDAVCDQEFEARNSNAGVPFALPLRMSSNRRPPRKNVPRISCVQRSPKISTDWPNNPPGIGSPAVEPLERLLGIGGGMRSRRAPGPSAYSTSRARTGARQCSQTSCGVVLWPHGR